MGISVADPRFPGGGASNPAGGRGALTYYLAYFLPKTAWKWQLNRLRGCALLVQILQWEETLLDHSPFWRISQDGTSRGWQYIIRPFFSQKLRGNEEISADRGHASLHPSPVNPPMRWDESLTLRIKESRVSLWWLVMEMAFWPELISSWPHFHF